MEFQKILPADSSIVMFAKIAVNQGRSPGIEKHDFYDAIVKRANELRADGESKEQAFTKTIVEDETGRLLYQAMKLAPGAEVKPVPQPSPPSPEAAAQLLGPAHARLHSQAVDHKRANPRFSYEVAYSRMYTAPENAGLRAEINREHLGASMAAVHGHGELGKAAAPPDPSQDDVSPGPAHDELNERVVTRMKSDPSLSYAQAFTREYLHPDNRSLKSRVDAESILHAQRLAPAPPFPAYARG
jgi:hypothetical protein